MGKLSPVPRASFPEGTLADRKRTIMERRRERCCPISAASAAKTRGNWGAAARVDSLEKLARGEIQSASDEEVRVMREHKGVRHLH